MTNIEKRINIIKKIIIDYFFNNKIHKSSCLAQSFLLYKYLYNLKSETRIIPKLIKGYIINHDLKTYYGHFWIEYDDKIYDIATDTYLLDYELKYHDKIRNNRHLSLDIPSNYENIDMPMFNIIRDESYMMCLNNKFLEDVEKKAPKQIYNKIKKIYNILFKNKPNSINTEIENKNEICYKTVINTGFAYKIIDYKEKQELLNIITKLESKNIPNDIKNKIIHINLEIIKINNI